MEKEKAQAQDKPEGYDLLRQLRRELGFDFKVVLIVTKKQIFISGLDSVLVIDEGEDDAPAGAHLGRKKLRIESERTALDNEANYFG